MSHTLIEKLIPLIASTFGIGLIRSMAYGMLSRLIRRAVRKLLTLLIILFCIVLFLQFWN